MTVGKASATPLAMALGAPRRACGENCVAMSYPAVLRDPPRGAQEPWAVVTLACQAKWWQRGPRSQLPADVFSPLEVTGEEGMGHQRPCGALVPPAPQGRRFCGGTGRLSGHRIKSRRRMQVPDLRVLCSTSQQFRNPALPLARGESSFLRADLLLTPVTSVRGLN